MAERRTDEDVAVVREALERKRVRRDIGHRIASMPHPSKDEALAALARLEARLEAYERALRKTYAIQRALALSAETEEGA